MLGTAATPAGVVLAWLLPRPLDAIVAPPLVLLDVHLGAPGTAGPYARLAALVLGIVLTWTLYVLLARLAVRRLLRSPPPPG